MLTLIAEPGENLSKLAQRTVLAADERPEQYAAFVHQGYTVLARAGTQWKTMCRAFYRIKASFKQRKAI